MRREVAPRSNVALMADPKQGPALGDYFFIVMRVESPNPQRRFTAPTYKHATYQAADAEARRLADENPGSTFAVLEVKAVRRSKAQRRRVKVKEGFGRSRR